MIYQISIIFVQNKRDEQIQSKRNLRAEESMSEADDDDRDARISLNIEEILVKSRSEEPPIRFEAIRAARKLLSIDRNPPINELIAENFLPVLVECLAADAYPDLQFEAAWALTNIASGNSYQTQAVADANAVPFLLRLLNSSHPNVCEQAVWALGNLIGIELNFENCSNLTIVQIR